MPFVRTPSETTELQCTPSRGKRKSASFLGSFVHEGSEEKKGSRVAFFMLDRNTETI